MFCVVGPSEEVICRNIQGSDVNRQVLGVVECFMSGIWVLY